MAIVPISRLQFAGKSWRRPTDCGFAAAWTSVPVGHVEAAKLACNFALAWVKGNDGWRLIALTTLVGGRNLYVSQDGQWLGRYVPTGLRGYPFRLLRDTRSQTPWAVGYDDSHGLLLDESTPGTEPFLNADGQPSEALASVAQFLIARESSFAASKAVAQALQARELLVPWTNPLDASLAARWPNGLHRVDESRWAALSDADFLEMRRLGAIELVVAQWVSEQAAGHLPLLEQVGAQRQPARTKDLKLSISDGQFQFD